MSCKQMRRTRLSLLTQNTISQDTVCHHNAEECVFILTLNANSYVYTGGSMK